MAKKKKRTAYEDLQEQLGLEKYDQKKVMKQNIEMSKQNAKNNTSSVKRSVAPINRNNQSVATQILTGANNFNRNQFSNASIKTNQRQQINTNSNSGAGYVAKRAGVGVAKGVLGVGQSALTEGASGMKQGQNNKSFSNIMENIMSLNPLMGSSIKTADALGNLFKKDKKTTKEKVTDFALDLASSSTKSLNAHNQILGMIAPKDSYKEVLKTNDKISAPIKKIDKKLEKEAKKYGKGTQYAGEVAEVVGNMVPSIGASILTKNPNVGLATMGMSAKGNATMEALENGEDLERATKIGTLKGEIEIGTEMMTGGLSGFGKGFLNKLGEKTGLNVGEKLISKTTGKINNKMLAKVVNKTLNVGKNVGGEVLEETVSDVLNTAIDKNTYNPDAKYSWEDWEHTAGVTIASTIVLNALTNGMAKGLNRVDKINNTQMAKLNINDVTDGILDKAIKKAESTLNTEFTDGDKAIINDIVNEQINKTSESQNENKNVEPQEQLADNEINPLQDQLGSTDTNNTNNDALEKTTNSSLKQYKSEDIKRFSTNKNNLIDNVNGSLNDFVTSFYDETTKKAKKSNNKTTQKMFLGRINDRVSKIIDNVLNDSGKFSEKYNTKDTNVVISSNNIEHIYNQHGNEYRKGQVDVTPENLSKYGEVIANPDYIGLSDKKSRGNTPTLLFSKKINGYSVAVEVLSTKKQLYPESYYVFESNSNEYKKFIEDYKLKKAESVVSNESIDSDDSNVLDDTPVASKEVSQARVKSPTSHTSNNNNIPQNTQKVNDGISTTNNMQNNEKNTQQQVKKAVAPIQQENKVLKQEIKQLKKEVTNLKENASITLKEFEEQNKKIAPLLEERTEPPKKEIAPSIKDTTKMKTKDLKALSKNLQKVMGLTRKQKLDLENIIQEYSVSPLQTKADLFDIIKDRYGKYAVETEFEEIKNLQKEIKDTKLYVSQDIKNNITDYNKLKQKNFGKIRFSNDGVNVDSLYQELSSKYPNYFPDNILNETDQFNKIVEVANLENKSIDEMKIDDEYLKEISNYIDSSITDYNEDVIKTLIELDRKGSLEDLLNNKDLEPPSEETLDKQTRNIQEIVNRAKEHPEQYLPYLEMAKEINPKETQDIIDLLNKVDKENADTESVKVKPKKHGMIADAKRVLQYAFVNENVDIDEYAKETGNNNIKILADHINNIQGEVETNINDTQRDNYGNVIGKGITQIFDQARQENLSEPFNDYLFHKSNVARHKQGKGSVIPINESEQLIKEYEKANPEFKKWAKEVNDYNTNLLYKQVDAGLITEDLAESLTKMYDFYVPFFENMENEYAQNVSKQIKTRSTIKSAIGGANKNLLSFEEAMVKQTQSAITQIRKNQLYNEIIKTKANKSMDFEDNANPNADSGIYTSDGKHYLTAYENGKATQVEIDSDLYHGLSKDLKQKVKQTEKRLRIITTPLQKISSIRRNILTTWSPTFIITNPLKDLQDAPLNSKYAKDWAKNVPRAFKEMATGKGEKLDAFLGMYGKADLRGDYNLESGLSDVTKLAKTNKKTNANGIVEVSKKMLKKIPQMNEIIEMAPRYAEYLASLENGCSQMEALYNAREVTTNFGRGGIITKALNRNGFTFLNANVQGMSKLIRNFSGENGGRAVLGCIAKATAFGIAPALINAMLFGDDDDYEAIPDYIKDNYYLIKTSDNGFIRIPKGRMMSIFGSGARRALESTQGREKSFDGYITNAYNQVGVQNPIESNIFAPLIQAKNNKTWYGTDLIPKRLQTDKDGNKIPAKDQYDSGTDKMSIWLGKHTGISPYKINYVIDQYSGGIGDMILPTITEEAQSKSESVVGKAIAPLKDKFTADSITDNKNVTNFYSKLEELGTKKNETGSKEDDIKYQYMKNISYEMGSLYKEMREVQADKNISDSKKYVKAQNIKAEINKLAEEGMKGYKDVEFYDNYARVGDRELYKYKNKKGETSWSLSDSKYADDINTLGLTVKEKNTYYTTKMKMSDVANQYGENEGSKRYKAVLKTIRKSDLPSDAKYELYNSWYGKNDTESTAVQDVGIEADDYLKFKTADLSADKNSKGYSIRGSKTKNVIKYLNKSKNLNYGEKAVLYRLAFGYKGQYSSTSYSNAYNSAIVNYVNKLNTTYDEDKNIYKTLGFKVDKKGNIWW